MTDSDFEAWLDEEWPVRKGPFDESVPISTSIKNDSYRVGARAAWAKAKERSDKLVEVLQSIACKRDNVGQWLCDEASQALKEYGIETDKEQAE